MLSRAVRGDPVTHVETMRSDQNFAEKSSTIQSLICRRGQMKQVLSFTASFCLPCRKKWLDLQQTFCDHETSMEMKTNIL